MLWLPGLRPGPNWGSLQRSPGSYWNKQYFIRNNCRNTAEKSNSELVTPINIIFDCIEELFMLVIALCTACFSGLKSIKTLAPLLLDLAPYFECSGAGTVCMSINFYREAVAVSNRLAFLYVNEPESTQSGGWVVKVVLRLKGY